MTVKQSSTIAHLATDPLRNFKFLVTLLPPSGSGVPGVSSGAGAQMGFMSVSGLNMTIDVIAYREGGYNTTTQKMPGQADFSPITLTSGIAVGASGTSTGATSWDWMEQLFTVLQGTGTAGDGNNFRWQVLLQILDHPVTTASVNVLAEFLIYNVWPTSLSFSDLDAGANQLFINQLVLAHEGYNFSLASALATDAAALVGRTSA